MPLALRLHDDQVKAFSQLVVHPMAKLIPPRFVAMASGKDRARMIFIECLRNGRAQTTGCSFWTRSWPMDWRADGVDVGAAQFIASLTIDVLFFRAPIMARHPTSGEVADL